MSKGRGPNRRVFLTAMAAAGGGLIVGLRVGAALPQPVGRAVPPFPRAPRGSGLYSGIEINAWIVIRPDDTVIIRVARSELGQGTLTGLAQLVAEELDCDWARVTIEQPLPGLSTANDRDWRDYATSNSRGVRASQDYMRLAGAAARWMLLEAAAEHWNVPSAELAVDKGVIAHAATKRSLSYGRIAPAAARLRPPDARLLKLKETKAWRIAGRPLKRLDTADKLTGRAVYGIDVKLPGMLSAAIRQAPVFGAKLVDFDVTGIAGMPGVRHVLRVGDNAVAIVADSWWQAHTAVNVLAVSWTEPPEARVSSSSVAEFLKEGLEAKEAFIGHTHGDALKAIAGAAKKVEAVYSLPFQSQAPLEPMNCTARWTPGKVEVWVSTQNAEAALKAAAAAAGLPATAAEVYKCQVGGSFGRRSRHDFVTQAVLIARQLPDTPVKLIWSREEDMQHGFFRPIAQVKLTGGIDDKGDLAGLIVRISGQSIIASQVPQALHSGKDARMFQGLHADAGEAQIGYSVPNVYIDHAMRNTHVPVGSWRGGQNNQNTFALECFIDEVARAAERDPFDFRRALMRSHPRHLAVLSAAAERAGWGDPTADDRHRGIAQCMSYGSFAAAVAEVSMGAEGRVQIQRVVLALDCGNVVNPDQVAAQIEGSVAFALSALFHQEITLRNGRVVESNFDSYGVLRLEQMPRVEAVLVPSGEAWGGVGAACVAVVAPAVANAIFAASGKRVRALPIRNGRVI